MRKLTDSPISASLCPRDPPSIFSRHRGLGPWDGRHPETGSLSRGEHAARLAASPMIFYFPIGQTFRLTPPGPIIQITSMKSRDQPRRRLPPAIHSRHRWTQIRRGCRLCGGTPRRAQQVRRRPRAAALLRPARHHHRRGLALDFFHLHTDGKALPADLTWIVGRGILDQLHIAPSNETSLPEIHGDITLSETRTGKCCPRSESGQDIPESVYALCI